MDRNCVGKSKRAVGWVVRSFGEGRENERVVQGLTGWREDRIPRG